MWQSPPQRDDNFVAGLVSANMACIPGLNTDCHVRPELVERVVELLAMTDIHFGGVREHDPFRQHDDIDGRSPT